LVADNSAAEIAGELLGIGAGHHERGIESACVLGSYRLYRAHLRELIDSTPEIAPLIAKHLKRPWTNDYFATWP